eukprot:1968628-Pyramimonas_sp.AAC.1
METGGDGAPKSPMHGTNEYVSRACLSADCPAVQSTTQEANRVDSLCADARIFQEALGFNQASGQTRTYTYSSLFYVCYET